MRATTSLKAALVSAAASLASVFFRPCFSHPWWEGAGRVQTCWPYCYATSCRWLLSTHHSFMYDALAHFVIYSTPTRRKECPYCPMGCLYHSQMYKPTVHRKVLIHYLYIKCICTMKNMFRLIRFMTFIFMRRTISPPPSQHSKLNTEICFGISRIICIWSPLLGMHVSTEHVCFYLLKCVLHT